MLLKNNTIFLGPIYFQRKKFKRTNVYTRLFTWQTRKLKQSTTKNSQNTFKNKMEEYQ